MNQKSILLIIGVIQLLILVISWLIPSVWLVTVLVVISLGLTSYSVFQHRSKLTENVELSENELKLEAVVDYSYLLDSALEKVSEQFGFMHSDMDQMRDIVNSATKKLSSSFTGMESNSMGQIQMLENLINKLIEAAEGDEHELQTMRY